MKKNILIFLCLTLLTVGCATPYGKYSNNIFSLNTQQGYSDFQIDENTFSVSFRSNENTPQGTVYAYALRRSAEVVLQHGFDYFEVVSERDQTTHQTNTSNSGSYVSAYVQTFPAITVHVRGYHQPRTEKSYKAIDVLSNQP